MTGLWIGLAGWAIASGGLLIAALLAAHRYRTGVPRLDVLTVGFLWTFLTTLLVITLGLVGLLRAGPALVASGAMLIGAVAGAGRAEVTGTWRAAGSALGEVVGHLRRTARAHPALLGGALALAGLQALRIAVHVWVLPPYVWDGLSYHLMHVAEWIQRGEIGLFETPTDRARWPVNHELLQTWFALFPHHDVLVDAASVPAYLLAIGSTYAIARRLGAGRGLAGFAALAYAYTPAVTLHATSVNNDLPVTALYLLVAAMLLHLDDHRMEVRPTLVVVVLALALALGTKAYTVFLAPGLLVIGLSALRARSRAGPPAPRAAPGPLAPALLVGLIGGGLLLGGYWYVRNWVLFGNPFSPADFRLFGHLVFGSGHSTVQQGTFSLTGLVQNLSMLWDKVQDRGPFNPDLHGIAGWGWFSIGLGIPTLAYGLAVRRELRWLAVAFGVSFLSLLSWVTPDLWSLRFALWVPALPAVAFAVAVGETRRRAVRRGLLGLATLALLLNLAGTLTVADLTPAQWRALLAVPVTQRSSAMLQALPGANRLGTSYLRATERLPREETLGYHVPSHMVVYPLYGADLSRRLRYVPIESDTRMGEALDRREIRHVFILRPGPAARAAIARAVARGELVLVDQGLFARAP